MKNIFRFARRMYCASSSEGQKKRVSELPNPFQQSRSRNAEPMPTKDRFPPKGYNKLDTRTRLAVLIDASKITPNMYENELLPVLTENATLKKDCLMLLQRLFAHTISVDWKKAFGPYAQVPEPFTVEAFIPVTMQMTADAYHITEFRSDNKYGGIVFVCGSEDRVAFEMLTERMAGHGMKQLILDSAGRLTHH